MLELKNVKKVYTTKAGEVNALNGVSLVFPSSGLVFITGKSGCGKTTMLNVIGGLDGVDEGEISVLDKDFSSFTPAEYDSYRNTFIGFIFQEYNLLPEFTVEKNIKIAMELQGRTIGDKELNDLLKKVDIEDLKNRKPSELSGGQRQRVAIARALVKNPRIIMADEPTGALDSNTGVQVLETLKKLAKDKLVIVVSHDLELAEKYADRIIRLVDGQVAEDATYTENKIEANIRERQDTVLIKEGADLSEEDKNVLAAAIKNRKKLEVIEKLSYRDKKPTGAVQKAKTDGPIKLQKSKMKLRSSTALGVKSLAVKPLRLIFTILLSAVAFAVFGLFDTIASFNSSRVINNLLRTSSSPTVIASARYILDKKGGDEYSFKFSESEIDKLEAESGYNIKAIFDVGHNTNGSTHTIYPISEILATMVSEGTGYYAKNVSGFIEFKKDEINGDNIGNFGYKLAMGKYPELEIIQESGKATYESVHTVAISTYLAESILHYLDGASIGDEEIKEIKDLIGKKITVNYVEYTISGLIDCGDIPQKYDALKTSTASREETRALTADFTSYISSSAHTCLFVADGFEKETRRDAKNVGSVVYAGSANWVVKTPDGVERQANEYMYASRDFTTDNVFYLDTDRYTDDKAITLSDDEVIIHISNLSTLFYKEIESKTSLLNAEERKEANALIVKLNNNKYTRAERNDYLEQIFSILKLKGADREREIKLTKITKGAGTETKKTVNVVGVYFGVDADLGINPARYRLMANDNLLAEFGAYPGQGYYNKIIFRPTETAYGSSVIAEYMSNKEGFALTWYGNTVLNTIEENESTIKQAADLFLYIALVLAVFSVFMLFNYITTSIVSKRQTIGVLRGLGSGGKDIFLMFMSESLIIAMFNGILASAIASIGCIFVNQYIINVMNISISFALFDIRQVLIIFGMSIFTAIISSAIPIIRITKEKPVDLIRRP